jgi:hypothetical protein
MHRSAHLSQISHRPALLRFASLTLMAYFFFQIHVVTAALALLQTPRLRLFLAAPHTIIVVLFNMVSGAQ